MNRNKYYIFVLIFLCIYTGSTLAQSKKSGNVVSREREVQNFDAIVANGTFELIVAQGDTNGLIVEAEENIQEFIKTNVDDNVLKIDIIESNKKSKVLKIHVTVANLKSIILLGNVTGRSEGILNCDKLFVFIGGTASARLNLLCGDLDMELGDASNAIITGSTDIFKIRATDDSDLDAFALESQKCSLKVTGFPEVRINVASELDLIVTGGGNVYYTGDPVIKNRIFAGSGFVVKRRVEANTKESQENKVNKNPKPEKTTNEVEEDLEE